MLLAAAAHAPDDSEPALLRQLRDRQSQLVLHLGSPRPGQGAAVKNITCTRIYVTNKQTFWEDRANKKRGRLNHIKILLPLFQEPSLARAEDALDPLAARHAAAHVVIPGGSGRQLPSPVRSLAQQTV